MIQSCTSETLSSHFDVPVCGLVSVSVRISMNCRFLTPTLQNRAKLQSTVWEAVPGHIRAQMYPGTSGRTPRPTGSAHPGFDFWMVHWKTWNIMSALNIQEKRIHVVKNMEGLSHSNKRISSVLWSLGQGRPLEAQLWHLWRHNAKYVVSLVYREIISTRHPPTSCFSYFGILFYHPRCPSWHEPDLPYLSRLSLVADPTMHWSIYPRG